MTNGDYIRKSLTDEAMVKNPRLLCEISYSFLRTNSESPWDCTGCPFDKGDLCTGNAEGGLMEWLKAEREEEGTVECP